MQLRVKDRAEPDLRAQIATAREMCARHGAQLVVNDYWRLAIEEGCDFVHLGQGDLDAADIPALRRAGVRIGVSTHDEAELDRALSLDADYVALGPIYPTLLKQMALRRRASPGSATWKAQIGETPLVAIGGLTPERAIAALAAGADSACVVTDILRSADPEARAREWLAATQPWRERRGLFRARLRRRARLPLAQSWRAPAADLVAGASLHGDADGGIGARPALQSALRGLGALCRQRGRRRAAARAGVAARLACRDKLLGRRDRHELRLDRNRNRSSRPRRPASLSGGANRGDGGARQGHLPAPCDTARARAGAFRHRARAASGTPASSFPGRNSPATASGGSPMRISALARRRSHSATRAPRSRRSSATSQLTAIASSKPASMTPRPFRRSKRFSVTSAAANVDGRADGETRVALASLVATLGERV